MYTHHIYIYICIGHVGYLPINDTWLGGPRAVGKTWAEAKKVHKLVVFVVALVFAMLHGFVC